MKINLDFNQKSCAKNALTFFSEILRNSIDQSSNEIACFIDLKEHLIPYAVKLLLKNSKTTVSEGIF